VVGWSRVFKPCNNQSISYNELGKSFMASAVSFAEISAQVRQLAWQLQPPAWLLHELQDKLVILLNHVLSQEPAAIERLRRQQGRCVQVSWRQLSLQWTVTPAGLLERSDTSQTPDLRVHVNEESPINLLQGLRTGQKPTMRVEGDVMLAAELNWLVDHVRWDAEEDLSRLVGDAWAHKLVGLAKRVFKALSEFSRQ
jgi:ubiquinone biosynthesis protein UbiJ